MNCTYTQNTLCGKVDCMICATRSFASHPRASNWSKQNTVEAHQVLRNSNKKYIFHCYDCNHDFNAIVNNITAGLWCKYCNQNGLCDSDDCMFCYRKSFASHPMAEHWSARNEVKPRQLMARSDKKMWFDCKKCNHTFNVNLYSITKDFHCKYCSNQKLCEDESCQNCFEKSCASHEMAESWLPSNETQPRMVFLQTNKKYGFHCKTCNHDYETTPNHYYNRDNQCSYCSNRKLCQVESCQSCYQKSFASHPYSPYWSTKNTFLPRTVFKGAETRAFFNCDLCQSEFDTKLYNVLSGYWCPYCKKKTEKMMLEFLKKEYDSKSQVRFEWCRWSKTNNIMPFDFGVENNILIELDGRQHFSNVSNWGDYKVIQQKDIEKIQHCIKNGKHIIHLLQEDVWFNRYDWKNLLKNEIERLKKVDNPTCVFLQNSDEYSSHIEQLGDEIKVEIKNPTS